MKKKISPNVNQSSLDNCSGEFKAMYNGQPKSLSNLINIICVNFCPHEQCKVDCGKCIGDAYLVLSIVLLNYDTEQ